MPPIKILSVKLSVAVIRLGASHWTLWLRAATRVIGAATIHAQAEFSALCARHEHIHL